MCSYVTSLAGFLRKEGQKISSAFSRWMAFLAKSLVMCQRKVEEEYKGKVWQNSDEGLEPRGWSAPPSSISGRGPPPACSSLLHHPHLASGWLQGKLGQRSDPTENKSTKKRKDSCPSSLLIQLRNSCTAAKSDARAARDVQGPGKGRERGSATLPLPGKAAAAGTSYQSVTWKPYPPFVWAKFPESVLQAAPDRKLTEECWCCPSKGKSGALSVTECGGDGKDVTKQLSPGWRCCSRSFNMHVNSMSRFKKSYPNVAGFSTLLLK